MLFQTFLACIKIRTNWQFYSVDYNIIIIIIIVGAGLVLLLILLLFNVNFQTSPLLTVGVTFCCCVRLGDCCKSKPTRLARGLPESPAKAALITFAFGAITPREPAWPVAPEPMLLLVPLLLLLVPLLPYNKTCTNKLNRFPISFLWSFITCDWSHLIDLNRRSQIGHASV